MKIEEDKEISIREELEKEGVPPFITRPNKTDKIIWIFFFLVTVFNFGTIPLRLWFMNNPEWYSAIIGGYTSSILLGAHSQETGYPYVFLSIIGACKFLPLYYFMGKYWGRDFIDYTTQAMPKLNKKLLHYIDDEKHKLKKYGYMLVPFSYIPGARIGKTITTPVLILARENFMKIFLANAVSVVLVNSIFYYLGNIFGEQVIEVVKVFNKYSGIIITGLIIYAVFIGVYKNNKNNKKEYNKNNNK